MTKDYIESEHFKLIRGKEQLSLYQWNDNEVNHYFCSHCGIYPFHDSIDEPGKYRVNLGCVEGIDPRHLTIHQFDGKHLL